MNDPAFVSSLTKSDLIDIIFKNQPNLDHKDLEMAIKGLIKIVSNSLSTGQRIEIRGFGSFSLRYHSPRTGRNPKTGEKVDLPGKYVAHFKPGKELRDRVKEQ